MPIDKVSEIKTKMDHYAIRVKSTIWTNTSALLKTVQQRDNNNLSNEIFNYEYLTSNVHRVYLVCPLLSILANWKWGKQSAIILQMDINFHSMQLPIPAAIFLAAIWAHNSLSADSIVTAHPLYLPSSIIVAINFVVMG